MFHNLKNVLLLILTMISYSIRSYSWQLPVISPIFPLTSVLYSRNRLKLTTIEKTHRIRQQILENVEEKWWYGLQTGKSQRSCNFIHRLKVDHFSHDEVIKFLIHEFSCLGLFCKHYQILAKIKKFFFYFILVKTSGILRKGMRIYYTGKFKFQSG